MGATALEIIFDAWETDPVCAVTYAGSIPGDITAAVTADYTNRKFTVDTSTTGHAGTWTLTATGVTPDGTAIATLSTTITLTIGDPCEPPTTTMATVTDQTYQIGAEKLSFTWDAWTFDPTTCVMTYAATIPSALSTAVTCTVATRTCEVESALTTIIGYWGIVITAKTPNAVTVPSKSITINM